MYKICVVLFLFQINYHSNKVQSKDSIQVELARQLLVEAENGNVEKVIELVCNKAPFSADWVKYCLLSIWIFC